MGISTQTPKKNTLNDALQELLDTQFFQQIAHRNGSPFAEVLAKWLIQYTLVAASMNEAFDLNLELILYTLHGKNIQKIIAATNNCIKKNSNKK